MAISPTENPFVFDLSSTYGAVLLGAYLSCAFWGINVMQAYMYYWRYEQDPWPLKAVVAFLLYELAPSSRGTSSFSSYSVADTAHQILVTKAPWRTLVQNWGRVSTLAAIPQEPFHSIWVGCVITAIVQLYYMQRIVRFASTTRHARKWWLWLCYFFFGGVFLLQFPTMIGKSRPFPVIHRTHSADVSPPGYLYFTINHGVSDILAGHSVRLSTTFVVASLVTDSAIAAGMLILLKDASGYYGRDFKSSSTGAMVHKLSILVVNTGLLTVAINAIGLIVDFTNFGRNMWAAFPAFPASSAYVSAFLANLNARRYVRGEGGAVTITNVEDVSQCAVSRTRAYGLDAHVVSVKAGSGTASGSTGGDGVVEVRQEPSPLERAVNIQSHVVLDISKHPD
ncbi:hypothetical protein K488DRAFT_90331 [Vararia minispora EC-137]|uniref:Uncharacterized protein n=1 Tax=Vararia minispora EC-137 TaxID=1314806 RepID=A0ACB8Q8F7_9AGAM|nr:hypothetical protein K488DRAFT_90331 [Vararia minispora EC-137]